MIDLVALLGDTFRGHGCSDDTADDAYDEHCPEECLLDNGFVYFLLHQEQVLFLKKGNLYDA